jgi:hypothetical protein
MVESLTRVIRSPSFGNDCLEKRRSQIDRCWKDFRKNATTQDPWTALLEEEAHYIGNSDNVLSVAPEFGQFPYMCTRLQSQTGRGIRCFLWCFDDSSRLRAKRQRRRPPDRN